MTEAREAHPVPQTQPDSEDDAPEPVPLLRPTEGVPDVVADDAALRRTIEVFAAGSGPLAVDAERASGYRYGQRAYLVQLRREGAGTALIDPIACPDLSGLNAVLVDTEWVLHAATQDLPCLAELGMRPTRLFDTELAGRLAGFARVGLGSMVAQVLGYQLEKGHSAADWSTRPLPEPWLRYAALDVELLVELRDALARELAGQGKLSWAEQEFAGILQAGPPPKRTDPWRRTSGMHKIRRRRQLAAVRALWHTRDQIAWQRDLSPGRVLADSAIIAAARAMPNSVDGLLPLSGFHPRMPRGRLEQWLQAVEQARALPEEQLPPLTAPSTGPPPPRSWAEQDPQAATRLTAAKAALAALAEELQLPAENLVTPDTVRRITWEPPRHDGDVALDPATLGPALRGLGARAWQVDLAAPALGAAFRTAETAACDTDTSDATDAQLPEEGCGPDGAGRDTPG